ncbi:hypothetical protein D3C77_641290 [compost metagenome]
MAAVIPSRYPKTPDKIHAVPINVNEVKNRLWIISMTGLRYSLEMPKLPSSIAPAQNKYCSTGLLSTPQYSLNFSICSGDAELSPPIYALTGSRGDR